MAASTNFQVIGMGRAESARLDEAVQRALGSRQGRWRVQFIGGLGEDVWEMRVSGPVHSLSTLRSCWRVLQHSRPTAGQWPR